MTHLKTKRLRVLAILGMVSLTATVAQFGITFDTPVRFDDGNFVGNLIPPISTSHIVQADFNGDGFVDGVDWRGDYD